MCVGKNDGGKPGSNEPTPSRGFDIREIGARIGEFFTQTGKWFTEQKDKAVEFANRPETQEKIQGFKDKMSDYAKTLGEKISEGVKWIEGKLNQKDLSPKPDTEKPKSEPKETAKFVITMANINKFNRMYGGEHAKPVELHSRRLDSIIEQQKAKHSKTDELTARPNTGTQPPAQNPNGKGIEKENTPQENGRITASGAVIINRSREAAKARDESFKSRDFFQSGERMSPFDVRQALLSKFDSQNYKDKTGRDINAATCTAYVHGKPDMYAPAISKIESMNPDMKVDDLRGRDIRGAGDIYGKEDKPFTKEALDSRPESTHKTNVEIAKAVVAVMTTNTSMDTGKAISAERANLGYKAFEEKGLTPSEASIYREYGVISEETATRCDSVYRELQGIAAECQEHSIDKQIESERAEMPTSMSDSLTATELKVELALGNIDKAEYDAKISELEHAQNDVKTQEEYGKQIESERREVGTDYNVSQLAKNISYLTPTEIKIEVENGRMTPEEGQLRVEVYEALAKLDDAVVRADYADLEAVKDALSRDEGKNVLTGFPDDQNPRIIPEKCSDEGRAWYEQSQAIRSQSPDNELRLYSQIAAADSPAEQVAKIEELTLAYNNHAEIVEQHADKLLELVHEFRRK